MFTRHFAHTIALVATVVLASSVAGCGSDQTASSAGAGASAATTAASASDDRDAVRKTYLQFAAAVKAVDGEKACAVVSPVAQAELISGLKDFGTSTSSCPKAFESLIPMLGDVPYSVGKITIDGDSATVENPSAKSDEDRESQLVRIDDKWLIAGDSEGPNAGGVDRAKVKTWPTDWCAARVGMKRSQIEKLMGPPTEEISQDDAAKDGADPQMVWDFAEYHFSAFFNVDDLVRQLDVNDIDLSATEKRAIKCEFTRR